MYSAFTNAQIISIPETNKFLSTYPNVRIVPIARDTTYWKTNMKYEVLFTESYHENWNAGGNSLVAGLFKFDGKYIYNKKNLNWTSLARIFYGLNKQEDDFTRKTNDLVEVTSNIGLQTVDKWYASAQFRLTTQLSNGYLYKTDGNHVLKTAILAPGRIFIGAGAKYTQDNNFYVYISPFTENTTVVLHQELAESGDINKNKKRIYNKLGPWIDLYWKYNFYLDYTMTNKIAYYTDYINEFGLPDYFDWQLDISIPLHRLITVSFNTQIKYEKDILFDVEGSTTGEKERKLQMRQVFGVGLKYVM